jgi:hypothetical protein
MIFWSWRPDEVFFVLVSLVVRDVGLVLGRTEFEEVFFGRKEWSKTAIIASRAMPGNWRRNRHHSRRNLIVINIDVIILFCQVHTGPFSPRFGNLKVRDDAGEAPVTLAL